MNNKLLQQFGNIDIYLFDQLLKGRFQQCENIIDIGCGNGRNIEYFLKEGFNVYGIDINEKAIANVQNLSKELAPFNSINNFHVAAAEEISFPDNMFDLAICSAVLHFAADEKHFDRMIRSAWRVLKAGGYMFTRLASNIGIESLVVPIGNGRNLLPDGTERFLVDEETLLRYTHDLNGELFEPIKTTNVQNLRCMTTWCLKKKVI